MSMRNSAETAMMAIQKDGLKAKPGDKPPVATATGPYAGHSPSVGCD
jgi:hypothetical protein